MPDNNHIPGSGKVNESPKPRNTEPIKADLPVQEQPDPIKPEPPDKPLPKDKQTTIPGMEAPASAGKVVDFAAVRDGAAKGKEPEKAVEEPKPHRGRPPKADKTATRDKKFQSKEAGLSPSTKKKDSRTPGGVKSAPAVEPPVPEQPAEPKDATRAVKEEVVYLDLSELHAFKDHPFEVRDDAEMQALVESVKTGGVNQPAIVRPREGGGYEIVAGHRRQKASELAGYRNMPCIVREMTDDEAILAMTDDNLRHREHIRPMEKARALKQQVDAIKHQGVALKNVAEGDIGKRSTEVVGARNGINYKQVHSMNWCRSSRRWWMKRNCLSRPPWRFPSSAPKISSSSLFPLRESSPHRPSPKHRRCGNWTGTAN